MIGNRCTKQTRFLSQTPFNDLPLSISFDFISILFANICTSKIEIKFVFSVIDLEKCTCANLEKFP